MKIVENYSVYALKFAVMKQQLEKQQSVIDKVLSTPFFENECPFSLDDKNKLDCCENCNDDYKSCWLKYFEKMVEE